MRKLIRIALIGALFGLFTAVMPAGAKQNGAHKQAGPPDLAIAAGDSRDCEDNDFVTLDGDSKLWPPNHKYADYTATADASNDDEDGAGQDDFEDNPTLELFASNSDVVDGEEKPGSGPPDDVAGGPDANVPGGVVTEDGTSETAPIDFQLRAERSGQSREGRVYTIRFNATFTDHDGNAKDCTSLASDDPNYPQGDNVVEVEPFVVCVPHDMRPSQRTTECTAQGLPF